MRILFFSTNTNNSTAMVSGVESWGGMQHLVLSLSSVASQLLVVRREVRAGVSATTHEPLKINLFLLLAHPAWTRKGPQNDCCYCCCSKQCQAITDIQQWKLAVTHQNRAPPATSPPLTLARCSPAPLLQLRPAPSKGIVEFNAPLDTL